jgi:hypothetical protein
MTKAPSREFKRRQRDYQVQVRTDLAMPPNAKLVCWIVSEHWNEESGEAFVGTKTIAAEAGMSATTVKRMLLEPRMAVHMRIKFGSQGSNNSNRYWPIEHTGVQSIGPTVDQSKTPTNGSTSPAIGPKRGSDWSTGGHEPYNHTEGAPSVLPSLVDRQKTEPRVSAPDGADLRYLLHEAREAYALSQTQAEPLRTIISDALSIMPKSFVVTHITASPSCQDFLASIASAKMELTAYSS